MNYLKDYEEFLKLLNGNKVRYLIVGAYALSYYTRPRATEDMDIWISRDSSNAERFYKSIREFGVKTDKITPGKFEGKNILFSLGRAPYAIEVFTKQGNIDFNAAWRERKHGRFGKTPVSYISRNHLISIKRYYHRDKDIMDIGKLRKE